MSVTFQIAATDDDLIGWAVACPDRLPIDAGIYDYDRARHVATMHTATCTGEDCGHYGPEINAIMQPEVRDDLAINVNNHNATGLLRLLDLPTDTDGEPLVGSCAADDFLGRVQIALAISPADAGMPARTLVRALALAGATVIDMGRPEGYHDERLAQLADLAVAAVRAGRPVRWA